MVKLNIPLTKHRGYCAGHPWYYLLGGEIPSPKQIQAEAFQSDYVGYMANDLVEIDKRAEPRRSEALREWQVKFKADLKSDLSQYREIVRDLRLEREANPTKDNPVSCDEMHTSMSLKFAHLYNDFAHLALLDKLLGKQMDLFG